MSLWGGSPGPCCLALGSPDVALLASGLGRVKAKTALPWASTGRRCFLTHCLLGALGVQSRGVEPGCWVDLEQGGWLS